MKIISQVLLCCLLVSQLYAQVDMESGRAATNWLKLERSQSVSAEQLAQNRSLLQLNTNDELTLQRTGEDQLGLKHHRYQQTYKGVSVEDAEYLIHEQNGRATHANGHLIHNLDLSVTPSISENTALSIALQYINAVEYAWQNPEMEQFIKTLKEDAGATFYPNGELLILDPTHQQNPETSRLAYKFDIHTLAPHGNQFVYVDAQNGEVLQTENRIHNCTNVPVNGTTNYSGTVSFQACLNNGVYTSSSNIGGGIYVYNSGNNNDLSPTNLLTETDNFFDTDPTVNEVLWASEKTYDYYWDIHGRNSLNDNGMPLRSWVHYGNNFPGAFWYAGIQGMVYGDGDNILYSSITSLDAVAHEITHGVTNFSADLNYQYEPGALSESFSDIFAEVIEANYRPNGNDWIMGANFVILSGRNGLRNLSDPNDPTMFTRQPDTYGGNFWYTGNADSGGVHTNSGVQNYWFYLLSEGGTGINDNGDNYAVNGIGMEKAAAIAYQNLTNHLGSGAQYIDARNGAIQSAIDLYGAGSEEAIQTQAAWCAVGVGACLPENCAERDSMALVAFYDAITYWSGKPPWDLSQPMDTWHGIYLNAEGCVDIINFDEDYIGGTLVPELGNLTDLTKMDFGDNSFTDTIPAELGNLVNLNYLRLGGNYFTGNIPAELGNLDMLEYFYFGYNQLTGIIPAELGNMDSLQHLHINGNQLTGIIPAELGDITTLRTLDLRDNQLTGIIPAELGNLTNLIYANLYDNQLIGSIPAEVGNLPNLGGFAVYNNQLSGCYDNSLADWCNRFNAYQNSNARISDGNNFDVPWEDFCNSGLGTCVVDNCRQNDSLALRTFYYLTGGDNWYTPWDLSQPMENWAGISLNEDACVDKIIINDNNLTGTIPQVLENLSNLRYLDLDDNNFDGAIPDEIGNIITLDTLILSTNRLDNTIPISFTNLTNLRYLNLEDNKLEGAIPPYLGDMLSLEYLNIADNDFTDEIPGELGSLSNLIRLYMDENLLTGSLPVELTALSNLVMLEVNYNQLSGCYDEGLIPLCNLPSSSNSKISLGNNFDAPWEDFCNTLAGVCSQVWPGDFNRDGIANHIDVLYWGLAEGDTGPMRPVANSSWIGQDCPEWNSAVDGVNGKHQDADGNGVVDDLDYQILNDNYRLINTNGQFINSLTSSPLKFDMLQIESMKTGPSETTNTYELYVSSNIDPNTPVSLHGVACQVDFSSVLGLISVDIDVSNSVLEPTKVFSRYDANTEKMDIALTRTDDNDRELIGPAVTFIVIVHDLPGSDTYSIDVSGASSTGDEIITTTSETTIYSLNTLSNGITPQLFSSVSVVHEQCNGLGSANVLVAGGATPYSYNWSTGDTTQNVNNLPSGEYSITVTDDVGLYNVIPFRINGALPAYDDNGNLICGGNCPEFLAPYGNINNGAYHAANAVKSDGIIQNGTIEFKAGNMIELENGFSVEPNTNFSGEIENCDGN